MKRYFLFVALVFSVKALSQRKMMFDTSKIDAGTRLIGQYEHGDERKTYKHLNFLIDDPATIKTVLATLTVGYEGENMFQQNGFTIALVQDFIKVKSWIVNPGFNSALYNGHTYSFNIKKVKSLAKKYPFDYKFETVVLKSMDEFENYLDKQKENERFLFYYAPSFKYEGSFEVQFSRNKQFTSPKAISDYLAPIIEKIVPKAEYSCIYELNEKNMADQTQFTMKIISSKKLYDELQLDRLKKEAWAPTVEKEWFFL